MNPNMDSNEASSQVSSICEANQTVHIFSLAKQESQSMLLNHLRAPPLLTPTGSLVSGSSSSLKPESASPFWNGDDGLMERSGQSYTAFPYYRSASYSRSIDYGRENLNGVTVAFTASQRMELKQQALIYKYISASVPVPDNLLIPLKSNLRPHPYGLSAPSAGFFPSNSLGWSSLRLGYMGSSTSRDSEPGRCRRTDGKKWRCSRDTVADQKYCEKHMNRGRYRSRKPVEAQTAAHATNTNNIMPVTVISGRPIHAIPQLQQSKNEETANNSGIYGNCDPFLSFWNDDHGWLNNNNNNNNNTTYNKITAQSDHWTQLSMSNPKLQHQQCRRELLFTIQGRPSVPWKKMDELTQKSKLSLQLVALIGEGTRNASFAWYGGK
ncbi:growth-regulating factor 7 [Jatropha curcas]|uniref:growth-regulating factor 7 n=1 Tax=Jatropha curcas TaxID=180498 RepID=UPI001895A9B1|nr:growth-regulating factor 7 [Jatropha curcas]